MKVRNKMMRSLLFSLLFVGWVSGAHAATIALAIPDCSTESDLDIAVNADWDSINDASAGDPFVACVASGDYTGKGTITLTASGTSANPRWIIFDGNDAASHAYARADGDKAKLEQITCQGAWWRIIGLTFTRSVQGRLVQFEEGCDDHVFHENEATGGGNGGGAVRLRGADNITIQLSVIYNTIETAGVDNHCILINDSSNTMTNNSIISNEIFDCAGDSIQMSPASGGGAINGLLVEDNDLYLTTDQYSDCAGNKDPGGNCACAEEAVDTKRLGSGTNLTTFRGNRFFGFRTTDTGCGSTGGGGEAFNVNNRGPYLLLEDNIMFDNLWNLNLSNQASSDKHNYTIINNLFVDPQEDNVLMRQATEDVEFYYNTVLNSGEGGGDRLFDHRSGNSEAFCNTFADSDGDSNTTEKDAANDSDFQVYADADVVDPPEANSITVSPNAIASLNNTDFQVITRRITNPTVVTISNAVLGPTSDAFELCISETLGDTVGRGVDDTTTYNRPHAGFVPPTTLARGGIGMMGMGR